ncbi:MAG: Rrf2 family transcriptional regulator [Patescibacteria group bacterium]|nr:Rrf2 family transcriptional regulator [Patescibacteria group bacterium]
MLLSQKCQYALRAIFEVAKRAGEGPIKIDAIAASQAIPPRFLAAILHQLKQGGFVQSKRGAEGGYLLARPPRQISVGDIIRFIDGPVAPVACIAHEEETSKCPLRGGCVFMSMWKEVQQAMQNVYQKTTIQELIEREANMTDRAEPCIASYVI